MATVWELKSVLSPSMHRTLVKLQLNLHPVLPTWLLLSAFLYKQRDLYSPCMLKAVVPKTKSRK